MKKILFIADGKEPKSMIEAMLEYIGDEYKCKPKLSEVLNLSKMGQKLSAQEIPPKVKNADVIAFDYGGFYSIFGSCGFIDWWNRFFIQLIKDNQKKKWICYSALDTFEPEDRQLLEGLGVLFKW